MFNRVVVGCDGSPESRDAVALGAEIASATGAGLSLVGVSETTLFPIAGMTDRRTLHREMQRELYELKHDLAPDAAVHVVYGHSIPRSLTDFARRWHADLVVVGSHSGTEQGRVEISRRSRQLIGAPFNLAVAQRGFADRDNGLRHIGVGYEGGAESVAALELASELARTGSGELSVMTVVEYNATAVPVALAPGAAGWDAAFEDARKAALTETEHAAQRTGLRYSASAEVGSPGAQLRAFSDTVDLLVVGSRRWGTIARVIAGSVAETLVAGAGCSLLIARRPRANTPTKAS